MRTAWRVIIGLIVPFFAVVGLFPWYNRTYPLVAGIPFVYFWIFLWFPLTTLCLYLAWRMDPKTYEEG